MGKEPGNYTLEIHQKNTHRTIKNCHCEGAPRPWQSASPVPRPPCKNPYHREPVIDSLLWQSASLVFNGPLPKEGWHSKAVTGGYISVPHSLCPKMPPAAPFLSPAKEREKRTLPKPMVLDSLRGRGAVKIGTFCPCELNGATPSRAFALSLRLSTATRSALVLPVQAGKIRGSTARCDVVGIAPYEILSPYAA